MALILDASQNNSSWVLTKLSSQSTVVNRIVIRDPFTYSALLAAKRSGLDVTLEVTNYDALAAILAVPTQARALERLLGFNLKFIGTNADTFNDLLDLLHPSITIPSLTLDTPLTSTSSPAHHIPDDTLIYLDAYTSRPPFHYTASAHAPIFDMQAIKFSPGRFLHFPPNVLQLCAPLAGTTICVKVRFSPTQATNETIIDLGVLALERRGVTNLAVRMGPSTQYLINTITLRPERRDYIMNVRFKPQKGGLLEVYVNGSRLLDVVPNTIIGSTPPEFISIGPFSGTLYAAAAWDRALHDAELEIVSRVLNEFPTPILAVNPQHRYRVEALVIRNRNARLIDFDSIKTYSNARTIKVINETAPPQQYRKGFLPTLLAARTDFMYGLSPVPELAPFAVQLPPWVEHTHILDAPDVDYVTDVNTRIEEYVCGPHSLIAHSTNKNIDAFVLMDYCTKKTVTIDALRAALMITAHKVTIAELKSELLFKALEHNECITKLTFRVPQYILYFLELYLGVTLQEAENPEGWRPDYVIDFIRAELEQRSGQQDTYVDAYIKTCLASSTLFTPRSPIHKRQYFAWYFSQSGGNTCGIALLDTATGVFAAVMRRGTMPYKNVEFNTEPIQLIDGTTISRYETACIAIYRPPEPVNDELLPVIKGHIRFSSKTIDTRYGVGFVETTIVPLGDGGGMVLGLRNGNVDITEISLTDGTDNTLLLHPHNPSHIVCIDKSLALKWAFTVQRALVGNITIDPSDGNILICGSLPLYLDVVKQPEFKIYEGTVLEVTDETFFAIVEMYNEDEDIVKFTRIDESSMVDDMFTLSAQPQAFVCKLSSQNGHPIWTIMVSGSGTATAVTASGTSGMCYATYDSETQFDTVMDGTGRSNPTASLMAFDMTDGLFLWGTNISGASTLMVIVGGEEEGVFVTGVLNKTTTTFFNADNSVAAQCPSFSTITTFLAKYTAQGFFKYALTLENLVTGNNASGIAVACSDEGILLTCWKPAEYLNKTITIRNIYNEVVLTDNSFGVGLFIKFDQYGNIQWTVAVHGEFVSNVAAQQLGDGGYLLMGTSGANNNIRQFMYVEVPPLRTFHVEGKMIYEVGRKSIMKATMTDAKGQVKNIDKTFYVRVNEDGTF